MCGSPDIDPMHSRKTLVLSTIAWPCDGFNIVHDELSLLSFLQLTSKTFCKDHQGVQRTWCEGVCQT